MEYVREITLDVDLHKVIPVVRVKQGDASVRSVLAHLEKDGETYIPESDIIILFRCEKPDGYGVLFDNQTVDEDLGRPLVVDNQDGTIAVELLEQCTTCVGRCYCDLCFTKDEEILSTLPFILDVRRSPNTSRLAVSTNDMRTLVSRIKAAEDLMRGVAQSVGTLTLSTEWNGIASPYTQQIIVSGYQVTRNTKVDLVANPSVIDAMLASKTDEIMIINDNGYLTAYAVGGKPTTALTVQAGIYETLSV